MPSRSEGGGGSPERFFSRGNEKLYEAYSQLHTMAQDFDKPFDSPAILVVGHQTDGKSGDSHSCARFTALWCLQWTRNSMMSASAERGG